ncbi:MAG TPA: hypothetical protein V6D29_22135 [Leptolyngbyaceae cyanobacterium]
MYIIQVDRTFWLKGIWRGWLAFCDAPSGALVYRTLSKAKSSLEYYNKVFPEVNFIIQSLPN